jgi:uncharacterized protein with gpF-like domain
MTAVQLSRILGAAASLSPSQSRALISLICKGPSDVIPRGRMSRAESIHRKRATTAKTMEETIGRVLGYAKHETLRNLERHHRATIEAADKKTETPTVRATFDPVEFQRDLIVALEFDQADALQIAGQQLHDELGLDSPWTMPAKQTLEFIRHRQNLLSGVSDEIHQEIEDSLAEGIDNRESLRDMIKRISGKFEEIYNGRGKVIADTETAAAYSYSRNKAMKAAGIQRKKWLHSPLAKVPRESHLAMHGKIVPIDEPFPIGDPPLMYPHDPNGAAEEVINCHCISIPVE